MGVRLDDLITGNDALPDWPVVRDLLSQASPAQIITKEALSGGSRPESTGRLRVALIGLRGAGEWTLGKLAAERWAGPSWS